MAVVATLVDIQTCPQDVPSLPAWFAEVTLLARHLERRGILNAVCDQVLSWLHRPSELCNERTSDVARTVVRASAQNGPRRLYAYLTCFIPLLSSWENSMKQVHDADQFKEACS
jgi:hypothetical protein